METTIEKLKKETPKNLSGFRLNIFTGELPSKWNQGNAFVTKSVSCSCGNKENYLLTYEGIVKKGFFRKRIIAIKCSPAFMECPKCGKKEVIFNPEIHGWTGAFEESLPELNFDGAKRISDKSGEIIVNYSYQGTENYEEMLQDPEIDTPSDYFDTFSIYFREPNGAITEVISDECA